MKSINKRIKALINKHNIQNSRALKYQWMRTLINKIHISLEYHRNKVGLTIIIVSSKRNIMTLVYLLQKLARCFIILKILIKEV